MSETYFTPIDNLGELNQCICDNGAALIWFTGPDCRVCQDIKPKVGQLIAEQFPAIKPFQVDCATAPEAAAQRQVFTVPTMLIFFDGQELIRKSRSISLVQLVRELERPYRLFFS